jgi:hypothetical protein
LMHEAVRGERARIENRRIENRQRRIDAMAPDEAAAGKQ